MNKDTKMKTLKDFIAEVAQPKSPDEQAFIAKHGLVIHDYTVNDNGIFDGTIDTGVAQRLADYKNGLDKMVYESIITIKAGKPYDNIVDAEKERHKKQEIKKKIIDEGFDTITEDEFASLLEGLSASEAEEILSILQ